MGSSSSKLSKEDLIHLRQVTNFTDKSLKQSYKTFMQECPSGRMTEEAFISYNDDSFGKAKWNSHGYLGIYFKAFDRKEAGTLSFEELMVGQSLGMLGTKDEKIGWSFRVYDQQRKGYLTYDDLFAVQTCHDKMLLPIFGLPAHKKTAEQRCRLFFDYISKDYKVDTMNLEDFKRVVEIDRFIMLTQLD